MEIIEEQIKDNQSELSEEQKNALAASISQKFNQWDTDRSDQIAIARELMQYTYLQQGVKKYEGELEWKSDVKLNTIYNIKRTKKSAIWREIWQNPQQMFTVNGTNAQTEEMAKNQKAAIVDSLQKMNIGKQYDKAIDDLYDIGEMIFKTDWEKRTKVVKRQKKDVGFVYNNIIPLMTQAGYMQSDINIPVYENARVESISPFMFVFDHSKFKLYNKRSWDSCIKIYKRFDTIENIKNNTVYNIPDDVIDELKMQKDVESAENKEIIDLRDETQYGGQYSVLYAHGDFVVDGKTYKNYIAEVLADKWLIRFEENPMFINPFIFCALEYNPLTKRGISPLLSVLNMCKEEEKLTNNAFDVQKLTANPPCWVHEDLLNDENTNTDGTIPYSPGKLLPFKNDYNGGQPVEAKFSAGGISDLLGLLNQKIADTSSVSSVMYGNIETQKRTATELNLADKGSSSQVSKELDTINQDLTIPMIENVAELLATFKDGVEYVYLQEKGENLQFKIDNTIRQAQYQYTYEDRNAINDRKNKFQELFQIFSTVGKDQELRQMINWREVLVTAVEMVGFDNSEKFFLPQTQEAQLFEQFKKLPDPVKKQLLPMFQQSAQQVIQQFQQTQRNNELQQQAMGDVQRDNYRDMIKQKLEQQQQLQQIQQLQGQGQGIPPQAV
ncbi:MAG: hypothetical protein LUH05_04000 [Candidatus Gastranaerophilales bacterium]|nr:hypothetical protein [Candidatus Gastranaerophilales bacterium]